MTDPAPSQVLTFTATTASAIYTFTTTALIPVGACIVVAQNRSVTTGSTTGIASITQSAGAATWNFGASGLRVTTHDTNLWVGKVTTAIPAGTTITVTTTNTSSTRRAAIMAVFNDVTSQVPQTFSDQTTGADGGLASYGDNGSGLTAITTPDAANTTADVIEFAAFSSGGTTTITAGTGMTAVGEAKTAAGSSDRGVFLTYKIVRSATGTTPTATATFSGTNSWAAASATYPITAATGTTIKGKVVVGGVKKSVASRSVVVSGAKRPVANIWVVVGGVKKLLP